MPLQQKTTEFETQLLLSDQPTNSIYAPECANAIEGIEVAQSLSLDDFVNRQSLIKNKNANELWNYLYVVGSADFELDGFEENLYSGESFVGVAKTIVKKSTQGIMDAIAYMQQHGSINVGTAQQTPRLHMMLIDINNIRVGDKIIHEGNQCIVCSIEPCEKGAKHIFHSHYIALAIDVKSKKAYAVDLRTAQKAI